MIEKYKLYSEQSQKKLNDANNLINFVKQTHLKQTSLDTHDFLEKRLFDIETCIVELCFQKEQNESKHKILIAGQPPVENILIIRRLENLNRLKSKILDEINSMFEDSI